ncbi:MAG: hypothetical protein JNM80_11520 [Phycisphaerae bacterium]|nr:hypothetical protein [Phycisphaerae bacterium]
MLASSRSAPSFACCAAALVCAPLAVAQSQDLGGGVSRFFPANAPEPAWIAIESKPRWQLPPAQGHSFEPVFSTPQGKFNATIRLPAAATLYGLGGLAGPLVRPRGLHVPPDARATPVVFGIKDDGSAFALIADTSAACEITVGESLSFSAAAPLAVVTLEGTDPVSVLGSLSTLTGRFEMPARWTLGLQQWGLASAADLHALAESSRSLALDLSVAWTSVGPATRSPAAADDPGRVVRMIDAGRREGVRVIGVIDPAAVHASADRVDINAAIEAGHLVGVALGGVGPVWPVLTRQQTFSWWKELAATGSGLGLSGWSGGTAFAGLDPAIRLAAEDSWGGDSTAGAFGSLLPMLGAKALYQSFGGDQSPVRPQVFATDAFAAGAQRFSGRLVPAGERDPLDALADALSIAMSGQHLIGLAIPAAGTVDEPTLRRWIGLAGLMPVMLSTLPWTQWEASGRSASVETLKVAMARRRALSTYFYTSCFDAFFRGQPLIRPLAFADPRNPGLRAESRGFLIGDSLLAMVPGKDGPTALPAELADRWVPAGDLLPSAQGLPDLYVRRGSIIPLTPADHSVAEGTVQRIRLFVHPAADGSATGVLYEDSGDGYEFYRNQASYRTYEAVTLPEGVEIRPTRLDGAFGIGKRLVDVHVVRPEGTVTATGSERGTVRVSFSPKPSPAQPTTPAPEPKP